MKATAVTLLLGASDVASKVLNDDLSLAFRNSFSLENSVHLPNAIEHELGNLELDNQYMFTLACAPYDGADALLSFIGNHQHQPVFSSKSSDRVCYSVASDYALPQIGGDSGIKLTPIPHILKIDDSVERIGSVGVSGSDGHRVLELSMGLGVGGKGIKVDMEETVHDIIDRAQALSQDDGDLSAHFKKFYWTSEIAFGVEPTAHTRIQLEEKKSRYISVTSSDVTCDFSSVEVHASRSHVLMVFPHDSVKQLPSCFMLVASVAALSPHVSHISAYEGYANMVNSIPYDSDSSHPTDQNAWLQSGNSKDTPYSDQGLDGTDYILGIVDSGVDDMSCFLIDDSKTPVPRTPKTQYLNPITDKKRRKVIQYVAFADGIPDKGYDHGTWCSGSALGKCIDRHKFKGADGYNGLAHNAKLTMFDVQVNGKMFVPSLYHIALPPAYAAGARVHSNSWGCRGITSYTSKALEVDEYMYEHPDFLFVVAAGNDGALGMDSVGSPGVSKNALTIGASASNHDNIVDFSGIGKAFDGMIKPDVIGPGTDLMSAGVGDDIRESCQIQLSSGTSMATPLISATAVLVKQYFESKKFWGTICNSNYRSCPGKDKGKPKEVSAVLLKAVLVHSAKDMKQVLSGWGSAVPKTNLTTPPDRFQGWGHVMLKNVLPLPGIYDFDLYVADYELLSSMSRREYFATVKGGKKRRHFTVTIAWNDPPNVVWAAKNLLNDIDLTVISPSGELFYGNNRPGDEFNAVERVLIVEPENGVYTVQVTSKQFLVGSEQAYSIVISGDCYVDESVTTLAVVESNDLTYSNEQLACQEKKGKLVRMQLEDWLAGQSWHNVFFTIAKEAVNSFTANSVGETVYIRTFRSNHDVRDATTNRVDQFSVCLDPDTKYIASILNLATPDDIGSDPTRVKYIRVAAPACNMFLSSLWQQQELLFDDQGCNVCPSSNSVVQVIMFANVTDDDASDYSWYGDARYEIHSMDSAGESKGIAMAGTLAVSDESADRVCLPHGFYEIRLDDKALFKLRHKHAAVVLLHGQNTIQLHGTQNAAFTVGTPSGEGSLRQHLRMGMYFLLGAVILITSLVCFRRQSESASRGSSAEMSPLIRT